MDPVPPPPPVFSTPSSHPRATRRKEKKTETKLRMVGGQDAGFLAQTRVVPSSRGGDAHGNSKQHVWKQTDREGDGGGWAAGRAKKPTKLQLAHTDTTQPTTTTPSVWRGRSLEGLEGSEEDEGKLSQVPRCVVCPPPASAVRGSFNVFVPPWHLNAHLQGQIPPSSVHHKRRLRMNAQSVQGDENGE